VSPRFLQQGNLFPGKSNLARAAIIKNLLKNSRKEEKRKIQEKKRRVNSKYFLIRQAPSLRIFFFK
jgi:hypothetical protein